MRDLVFFIIIYLCNSSHAYLVVGTRTAVVVKGAEASSVFIEGCDTEPCSKPIYKKDCEESDARWNCYLKDQNPMFVRFVVVQGGKFSSFFGLQKTWSSNFISTNGAEVLDNFILNIKGASLVIEPLPIGQ